MDYRFILVVFLSVILLFNKEISGLISKPVTRPVSHAKASGITIFLCGDVMIGRGIDQVLPSSVDPKIYETYVKDARDYVKIAERKSGAIPQQVRYDYIWGDALKVWESIAPVLKIINLETSITTNKEHWPDKLIQYRMHPDNVRVLTTAGIDCASLANNHVLDWQRSGLLETLQVLREAGIAYAGAGQDLEEAQKPAILKTGKNRVIVFAYGSASSGIPESWSASPKRSGVNFLPDLSIKTVQMISEQVKQVKKPGDVVVFSVHWGSNWGYDIPPRQREFARNLVEKAGVDIVYGHSSHHPQGIEVHHNKLIIYGAGDFINDYEGISGHEWFRGDLSLMYFPEVDPASGKLLSLKMVPMKINRFQLQHASPADAAWLLKVLDRESNKLGAGIVMNEDTTLSLTW
ncbi:CapA family protein [Pontibacter sp. MBLB2868]|uniref:CapA family protein n=1 Tax=Pontibacter sp. MBLB2868 TaxID=3451555 RepID=UPI003F74DF93